MPRFAYISPEKKIEPGVVYKNNELSKEGLKYAQAYRRKVHKEKNSEALVFTVQNPQQELQGLFNILNALKEGRDISTSLARSPKFLVQQGYFDIKGRPPKQIAEPSAEFKKAVKNKPHIEIIMNEAVLVMNENGMAFINSKGDAINANLEKFLQQQFWLKFYNKGDLKDRRYQQLAEKSSHFHKDIKQQDKDNNYDGVSWTLANLECFDGDIKAKDETLGKVKKLSRKKIVEYIDGEPDPSGLKSNKKFKLEYRDESPNQKQLDQRLVEITTASDRHKLFHAEAVKEEKEAKDTGKTHEFRQQPRYKQIKVLIAKPPQYSQDPDDVNKLTTTRDEKGIINKFELKKDEIVVKSTTPKAKPNVTYKERFTRIAEDLYASVFADKEGHVIFPVVIKDVKPPEEKQTCIEAFKEVFGEDKVIVKDATAADEDKQQEQVSARPVFELK